MSAQTNRHARSSCRWQSHRFHFRTITSSQSSCGRLFHKRRQETSQRQGARRQFLEHGKQRTGKNNTTFFAGFLFCLPFSTTLLHFFQHTYISLNNKFSSFALWAEGHVEKKVARDVCRACGTPRWMYTLLAPVLINGIIMDCDSKLPELSEDFKGDSFRFRDFQCQPLLIVIYCDRSAQLGTWILKVPHPGAF